MSEDRWPLPSTWRWRKAGEIAQIVGGGTPPASDEENFDDGGTPWITPADLTGYQGVYIARGRRGLSKKGLASGSARLLPAGTVLYSSRAPIGYCAIASNPIATNQGFKSLVLGDGFLPEFVRYYLLSSKDYAESLASGTTFKELSGSRIAEMLIPAAPRAEQCRIVAKLDSLFNRSKIARDNLARVPRLVERYKLAILAAAFCGDATANWRTAHPTGRSTPLIEHATGITRKREGGSTSADSSKRFKLPGTWRAATVESIGEVILGRQRSPENHQGPHMRSYVRAANITWDGWDLSDVKKMNFDEADFKKFKLQPGDVLINEGSGSADEVGKPAIWNGEIKDCCFQNTLIAVRPRATTSEYLYFVLLNAAVSKAFVDEARGVNIHHIGRAGLAQFVIPVPPIEEQQEIVRRIRAAFGKIESLVEESSRAARLIDRLDQATLAKAFRGELLPQDANGFERGTENNTDGRVHPRASAPSEAGVETEAEIPLGSTGTVARTMTGNARTLRSQATARSRRSRDT